MKNNGLKKDNVIILLIFTIGLLVLLYPTLSNFVNEIHLRNTIKNYSQEVKSTNDEEISADIKAANDYNTDLINESVPESFAKRMGVKNDKEYESLLDVDGSGVMAYIDVPSIGVSLPIYHYTTTEILKNGAGHLFGSSLPVGGRNTHTVITAHRGLPSAKMFTDLDQLEKGDKFFIKVLGKTLAYQVDHIKTVKPDETKELGIVKGEDYTTLITCTPYGSNTHRLLVRGHRVPYVEGDEDSETKHFHVPWNHIICVFIGIIVAVFLYFIIKRIIVRKSM
ncbi:MAG: class C sortase [Hornefia sp.]|nr:class C sortase [Hornefia sp.]